MADKKIPTCGDCIHADLCERCPQLDGFSRDNPAYCQWFVDKCKWTEVVRCKDCVWCEKGKSYEPYCNHPTDGMHDVQLDDFCSYGERRTDDE